jgi:CubicO group peptidase (beta-lactamase class C family)
MNLRSTFFVDPKIKMKSRARDNKFVSTQRCSWRGRILRGEVDDENAYAMGGVAGHAGLFSCARDIHRFVCGLRDCYWGRRGFLDSGVVREFFRRDRAVDNWTYALGWDTPSKLGSSSGKYFSAASVGHLGFTGTSIWWDLERDCHAILLSNRVHPTRENSKIRAFRPYVHDLIMERLVR